MSRGSRRSRSAAHKAGHKATRKHTGHHPLTKKQREHLAIARRHAGHRR